ncbi:MAG: hypothetical protein JWP32_1471 [Schumannella sp.]|nr:hypothetical protein [Schumannella sp.]
MRTRRLLIAFSLPAVLLLLTGCSLITALTSIPPVTAGSCLQDNVGGDADLTSPVACTRPHLYDVVALSTWPGMSDALEAADPAEVHHRLQIGGTAQADDYWEWSAEYCSTALRSAVGWTGSRLGVENASGEPLTSDGIWAMPGGSYYVDISLPAEQAFVAGDHRTVCSAAWTDATGALRSVSFPAGLTFADLFDDRMPVETRQCLDSDGIAVECTASDATEVTAQFDAVAASSEELVVEYATTEDDDVETTDLEQLDEICFALIDKLPHRADTVSALSWVIWDGDWDRVYRTGGLQNDVRYFAQCFANDPDQVTGHEPGENSA